MAPCLPSKPMFLVSIVYTAIITKILNSKPLCVISASEELDKTNMSHKDLSVSGLRPPTLQISERSIYPFGSFSSGSSSKLKSPDV